MLKSIEKRAKSAATIGVAAALVVAGVAAAQNEGSSGGSGGGPAGSAHHGKPPGAPPLGVGPAGGVPMKGLTYGELHVQKEGKERTIRLDEGKIVSVDSNSITLSENDGSEVTIELDAHTQVLAGPGGESSVEDLSTGDQVIVCGPEGEAAKTVVVPPRKGDMPKPPREGDRPPKGAPGQLPPMQGAQMGS